MVLSDGGAFDSAPDQVAVQAVGQVAAIEPVGPFPQIARQVLGADAVMGADEPGFDVAEEGMDDWEEGAGIGGFVLNHWRVLQMLGEGGNASLIRLQQAAQWTGRTLAQSVAQLMRHGPRRLVRHRQFAL